MFSEYFQTVIRQRRKLLLFIHVHGGEFFKKKYYLQKSITGCTVRLRGLHAARRPYVLWADCRGRKLVSFQLPVAESGHCVVTHCHICP